MQIDVFTLFPQWFDWFADQRHVRNSGARIECVDYREGTPLSGGQVDDTPYGGGAGMVIRVDVMEAAMQRRYGEAPPPRRVVALTASGRQFDDALAGELAEQSGLTLLCGRYEGFDERIVERPTRFRSARTSWQAASLRRWS
jgi:tRNA (guanine37-N1)-methyltransferase